MKTPEQRLEEFKERLEALCKEYGVDLHVDGTCRKLVVEAFSYGFHADYPTFVWKHDGDLVLDCPIIGATS